MSVSAGTHLAGGEAGQQERGGDRGERKPDVQEDQSRPQDETDPGDVRGEVSDPPTHRGSRIDGRIAWDTSRRGPVIRRPAPGWPHSFVLIVC